MVLFNNCIFILNFEILFSYLQSQISYRCKSVREQRIMLIRTGHFFMPIHHMPNIRSVITKLKYRRLPFPIICFALRRTTVVYLTIRESAAVLALPPVERFSTIVKYTIVMKKQSPGTLSVPVRTSLSDKLIYFYNSLAPADCVISNERDKHMVLTIAYLSLTFICPIFLFGVVRNFNRYQKGGRL